MTELLDDLDARPGSATSLLRTVTGAVMRERGGWLPTAVFVELLRALGVSPERTRTALSRVREKGLLVSEARERQPGYAIAPAAHDVLARGDRRIHQPRSMGDGDAWCLVSFNVPESRRQARHRLRKQLCWIGAGNVSQGLCILPAFLLDEAEDIVRRLELSDHVTLFVTHEVRGAAPLRELAARWWDLNAIRELHEGFLASRATDPAVWRAYPSEPPALLPHDWPGTRSIELYLGLREATAATASAYVDRFAGTA
ncbi:PaaX family transcriptional regulator [Leucobacter ruminantium]|uniref:Regulator n=1 Tax=Leucobacter ruminantium TaxID=1289170 RepID=A0A939LYQ6_9MICO|nr:regulator [Leucobacter ruminantium]MBO1806581.1 regulator [Leucobacter ruminantium]